MRCSIDLPESLVSTISQFLSQFLLKQRLSSPHVWAISPEVPENIACRSWLAGIDRAMNLLTAALAIQGPASTRTAFADIASHFFVGRYWLVLARRTRRQPGLAAFSCCRLRGCPSPIPFDLPQQGSHVWLRCRYERRRF